MADSIPWQLLPVVGTPAFSLLFILAAVRMLLKMLADGKIHADNAVQAQLESRDQVISVQRQALEERAREAEQMRDGLAHFADALGALRASVDRLS